MRIPTAAATHFTKSESETACLKRSFIRHHHSQFAVKRRSNLGKRTNLRRHHRTPVPRLRGNHCKPPALFWFLSNSHTWQSRNRHRPQPLVHNRTRTLRLFQDVVS